VLSSSVLRYEMSVVHLLSSSIPLFYRWLIT
jgi:hypothetical protein